MSSQSQGNTSTRRKVAVHNPYSSNTLHFKYPLLVAWWSLAFPGFGHFMVNSYLFGFFLMSVEFFLNNIAQVNTAIYYSMIGEFEQAKEVIHLKYFFVYVPLYIFTVWDSYRRGTELNQEFQLAYKDVGKSIKPFQFSMFEINPLRKKNPRMAFLWSLFFPPMVYIYLHRLVTVLFNAIWWIAIFYFSSIIEGVYYTMIGEFSKVKDVVNPQWLLFLPSIYTFTVYDVYARTTESNKLYEMEMSRFLKDNYQQGDIRNLYLEKGG